MGEMRKLAKFDGGKRRGGKVSESSDQIIDIDDSFNWD
jgi:hypothetical protein